jgi:hypothetical protein
VRIVVAATGNRRRRRHGGGVAAATTGSGLFSMSFLFCAIFRPYFTSSAGACNLYFYSDGLKLYLYQRTLSFSVATTGMGILYLYHGGVKGFEGLNIMAVCEQSGDVQAARVIAGGGVVLLACL